MLEDFSFEIDARKISKNVASGKTMKPEAERKILAEIFSDNIREAEGNLKAATSEIHLRSLRTVSEHEALHCKKSCCRAKTFSFVRIGAVGDVISKLRGRDILLDFVWEVEKVILGCEKFEAAE